jgi:predicted RNase H-like HicB family nuclease
MPVRKMTFRVTFVIEKDEGEYHAFCPGLKGLHTSGRTRVEALENAKCAVEAYIESLLNHNEPIPLFCVHERATEAGSGIRSSISNVEVTV